MLQQGIVGAGGDPVIASDGDGGDEGGGVRSLQMMSLGATPPVVCDSAPLCPSC